MKIYRNANGKINFRLKLNKNISFKAFYVSVSKSDNIYTFKYLYSSYNRFENGNATFYIYFFGLNITTYINGLKENKRTFKQFINY